MKNIKNIKKFVLFLIILSVILSIGLFLTTPACAEIKTLGKEIGLSENTAVITVYYLDGDEAWAENTLNLIAEILQTTEKVSGIPYPAPAHDPYGSDVGGIKIKICELTDTIKTCSNHEIGLKKSQDKITTTMQMVSIWNLQKFKDDWLTHGHTFLYTYLVLKDIDPEAAEKFKTSLFINYNTINSVDIPLEQWSFLYSVETEKQINKRNYGTVKSYIFMDLIYETYGKDAVIGARKKMDKSKIVPGSKEYQKILETTTNTTNGELDNLFSGWIFPGEYRVNHRENVEIKIALRKYDELHEIYKKNQNMKLYKNMTELGEKLYGQGNIKDSIEYADELIEKYNASKNRLKTTPDIAHGNTTGNKDIHDVQHMQEDKTQTEDTGNISKIRYKEAYDLYYDEEILTKIGLVFYDAKNAKSDLDNARTHLTDGNFEVSMKYSNRVISYLDGAKQFGIFVGILILIFFVLVVGFVVVLR